MTRTSLSLQRLWLVGAVILPAWTLGFAGYKVHPWKPRALETYAARQSSQGLTIAIDPLFRDPMAAQVFDKDDIVSRGIMPLAVVVFNDNDFAVHINSAAIELIQDDDHARTQEPQDFVPMLFKKTGSRVAIPVPVPRSPVPRGTASSANPSNEPLADFDSKALGDKTIGPRSTVGGFLYFRVPQAKNLPEQLSRATLYIPDISRVDNGGRLMYFEIELKPAILAAPAK